MEDSNVINIFLLFGLFPKNLSVCCLFFVFVNFGVTVTLIKCPLK